MKSPEERFIESILQPLVDNHSFAPELQDIESKGVMNYQQQVLTLGFQKYLERIDDGIAILDYFGEWKNPEVTADEVLSLQGEREQLLTQGISIRGLRDLIGIDDDRIDLYHARVKDLLEREEFEAAGSIALFILTLCPEDPAGWIAFGVCEQLSGRLVRGAHALVAAIELCGGILTPVLYCAKVLVHIGLQNHAKELLESTISSAKGDPKQHEFRKNAYRLYCTL